MTVFMETAVYDMQVSNCSCACDW